MLKVADIVAKGITNQRETTAVWERASGKPIFTSPGKTGAPKRCAMPCANKA